MGYTFVLFSFDGTKIEYNFEANLKFREISRKKSLFSHFGGQVTAKQCRPSVYRYSMSRL